YLSRPPYVSKGPWIQHRQKAAFFLEIRNRRPVMAQQSGPENSILVISYLGLRKAIGILGVALPFVLPFGQILLHALGIQSSLHSPVIANSVSSYYDTDMRNIFVGSMCAIGVFL